MAMRKIKGATITRAATALDELPELPKSERTFSTRETVKELTKQILKLRDRGYSMEQVSGALGKCGIEVSAASLRRYLAVPKPKSNK